jgi:L-fuculose-phosphate aldolase
MKQNLMSLKKNIIIAGKRLYESGYVASNDGNISARIDEKYFLITPTGFSKGFMKITDLAMVDLNGRVIKGRQKPSSETKLHLRIYKERRDVGGICHAHPPYGTGFAVAGIPLDQNVLPEVIISLGSIPLVKYGTPGTDEFCETLIPVLRQYDAFLLANHGALTVGSSVIDACNKMETLEHYAKILFVAKNLGKVCTLNADEVRKLISRRKIYGVREDVGVDQLDA